MRTLTLCAALVGAASITATLRAETHRYTPALSYNTYAADHPPALRIKSGDRVVTTTCEGMAQTGPFFIEGAEPGDLIVVSIEKLEPNRATGMSSSFMATAAFDSGGLSNKNAPAVPWTIDKAKGVVRLDLKQVIPNIDWAARYSPPVYELPLRPVLGSIGVAPSKNESLDSRTAGPFGGNVDSAAVGVGAKVLLPVYAPGALLYLGHGLARHGDGDVAGTGIETTLDVEFSVEVVKKKEWPHSSVARASTVAGEFELEWPRVETADYLMAIGGATSLQQALQHATTELHHWLDDDFGFSERSLSIFLGPAIEYEVANVAGPGFTVVAKVKKSYIPRIATAQ
jgi:acetamidase/formamidase